MSDNSKSLVADVNAPPAVVRSLSQEQLFTASPEQLDEKAFDLSQTVSQTDLRVTEQFLELALQVTRKSIRIQNCTKTVKFAHGMARNASLVLYAAKANNPGNAILTRLSDNTTYNDILNCDFLYVSDSGNYHQHCTTVTDVDVKISTKNAHQPYKIWFHSGAQYYLSDGYSVDYCRNLANSVAMLLN